MKVGKYVKLPSINNVVLSYGTVNAKELNSIYLRFQCWVHPKSEDKNWEGVIAKMRRDVRLACYHNINKDSFSENYIVDLDLRSSGIATSKRSFMSCEITLYVKEQTNIKTKDFKNEMNVFSGKILKSCHTLFKEFDIYTTKKGRKIMV